VAIAGGIAPTGADVEALTYDDYLAWAQNLHEATGGPMVGFPAGEGGLMHRFFQGYLIPAFSGGLLTTFTSDGAVEGWEYLAELWEYVHPQSTVYDFMQEPLLAEEVWVAWDHVARLIDAVEERPDDFIAVPAPSGPEGLAFMPVLAGLAIPETAPNPDGARELIRYLTEGQTQAITLQEVGFYPVIENDIPVDLPPGIEMQMEAVTQQAAAADALPSLLPDRLGEPGGVFNRAFIHA
jgi:multiple sugar transport system substrate-binding protein